MKKERENLKEDALTLCEIFTPESIAHYDQMKLVYFFKFLSVTANDHQYNVKMWRYTDAQQPFLDMIMNMGEDKDNHLEELAEILTLVLKSH